MDTIEDQLFAIVLWTYILGLSVIVTSIFFRLWGYLLGIAAKASYALIYQSSLPTIIWLYVLNSLTVGIDASLYLYYTRYRGARLSLRTGA